MKRDRRLLSTVLAVTVAGAGLLVTTLSGTAGAARPARGKLAPVVFVAIGPNSGAEYNPGPQSTYNQFKDLTAAYNKLGGIDGHPIKLDFFDNESSPSVEASLLPKIRADHPEIVESCCYPADMAPVNDVLQKSGPVTFNVPPPAPAPANSYVFSATQPLTNAEIVLTKFLKLNHWRRVALVYDTTPGENTAVTNLHAFAKADGISYVSNQVFDITATSVSTQIAQVAQAKPQAVVLFSTGHQIATVFSAINSSSLANVPVLTGDGNLFQSSLLAIANTLPKNLYIDAMPYLIAPARLPSTIQQVTSALYKAEGIPKAQEDNIPAYLVDNFAVPVYALQKLGWNAPEPKLENYIQHLTFSGLNGTFHFTPKNHFGFVGAAGGWGVVKVSASHGAIHIKAATTLGATALVK